MTILAALADRANERAEKFQMIKLRKLPNPYSLHEWATLGTYSYFLMQSKRRLTLYSGLLKLNKKTWETMSSVARDYLDIAYMKSPVIKHDQAEVYKAAYIPANGRIKNAPQYFKSSVKFEHGFYIDIISTYWSILSIVGWNLDYYPKRWLGQGRIPSDFPFPHHKTARACLVSVARPGELLQYNPGGTTPEERFPTKKIGSKIMNLGISLIISDVLHSIAGRAREAGAVYINADGYVAPDERPPGPLHKLFMTGACPPGSKAREAGKF